MHQQFKLGPPNPLLFAALAGFLAASPSLFAQGGGTGGGATSGGFSSFGSSSAGTSSFGQSGFGGSSFGSSGFGQSGFGSTTGGAGGGFNAITNTDQGFIGRSAADIQTFFGSTNQAFQTTDTRSSRSGGGGGDSSSEAGRRPLVRVSLSASRELRRSVSGVRPRVDIAIDQVARRLTRQGMNSVTLSANEGVTTLEGVVESDSQRRLAEKLAAIEPGVRRVENRLRVVEPAEEVYPLQR
ncbi:BON domain protein [Planctomycetes bacterium MalM25]|nr:BON domain protein [Planctomycetes bacterium MalM25]